MYIKINQSSGVWRFQNISQSQRSENLKFCAPFKWTLIGRKLTEREKERIEKEIKSVHIGYWDDAIGLTVSNSKVFSSDFQSFIFTSVLNYIYKAVLKKNWDSYETRCRKTVKPWFSGWINWLQVCNITLHLRTWIGCCQC